MLNETIFCDFQTPYEFDLPSSERPITVATFALGWDPIAPGGPKPPIDNVGRQIGTIATIEVAFTSTSPNVTQSMLL